MSDCRRFEDLSIEEIQEYRDKQIYFMIPKNMWMLIQSMRDEERGELLRGMFMYSKTGIFPGEDDDEINIFTNMTDSVLTVLRFWCSNEEKSFEKWVNKSLYCKSKASKRG